MNRIEAAAFADPSFIDTNGIRMAVYEQGSGAPVILLHGFPELAFSWRYQLPALAAGAHTIHLQGAISVYDFSVDVIYHINVVEPGVVIFP